MSKFHRTPAAPFDENLRYGVGLQYDWSERVTVGAAYEYPVLSPSAHGAFFSPIFDAAEFYRDLAVREERQRIEQLRQEI